jgi:hypothetical protein
MMPFAVAKCETTVMLGSPLTSPTRSRAGFSHQSISPRRNAAEAENGSKVSHSTRSKCATLGPAVKPTEPPALGWYSANRSKTARAPTTPTKTRVFARSAPRTSLGRVHQRIRKDDARREAAVSAVTGKKFLCSSGSGISTQVIDITYQSAFELACFGR